MRIHERFYEGEVLLGVQLIEGDRDALLMRLPEGQQHDLLSHVEEMGSDRRVKEWLATRVLLYELLGREVTILYHDNGSPYLSDGSYNISISHSRDYVAVLLSPSMHVGVDIEGVSERIYKIKERFVDESEYVAEDNELIHLLLHWSAKETLFKLMNESEVDFKEHLRIMPFVPEQEGVFEAMELKTLSRKKFQVHYGVYKDLVLTWAVDRG